MRRFFCFSCDIIEHFNSNRVGTYLLFYFHFLIISVTGGVAEKTGALHEGDRVLEIDNHNVSNVLLSEAIEFLHNSADKVLFKVSRNSSDIPRNSKLYKSQFLLTRYYEYPSFHSSFV